MLTPIPQNQRLGFETRSFSLFQRGDLQVPAVSFRGVYMEYMMGRNHLGHSYLLLFCFELVLLQTSLCFVVVIHLYNQTCAKTSLDKKNEKNLPPWVGFVVFWWCLTFIPYQKSPRPPRRGRIPQQIQVFDHQTGAAKCCCFCCPFFWVKQPMLNWLVVFHQPIWQILL